MRQHSTLALFVAVVGSGLIGMMIYAGVFYSNVRRDVRTSQEIDGSVYQSFEEAEKLANQWVAVGGTYTVKTSTRVRRSARPEGAAAHPS